MTIIWNRKTKQEEKEKIYGEKFLVFLYKEGILSKFFLFLVAKFSLVSRLFGFFQKTKRSCKKIKPFIQEYQMDTSEFLKKVEEFSSFNDFFIRQLKKETRPIEKGEEIAILPADARYLVFPSLQEKNHFFVKGKMFSLAKFLKSNALAKEYQDGSMVIARLCPTDYHRFHFPFDCQVETPYLINGFLYSVHPIALRKNVEIFSENKRVLTILHSKMFGKVLFLEIGATNVGSIEQTFLPKNVCKKGQEKGFFSFGGSSLVLLFQKGKIEFDQDLIDFSSKGMEVRGFLGQSLGRASQIGQCL